ncbi:MAG: hydantoinase/oxoprolinase family protein [Deltaproteobacteria bacterium]|nr:hydantoinase/oxoprolinase family protein [Deltaproteobacteria bacterium]
MILGLDVGGTQTDAVLIEKNAIVAATKTPTGDDLLETLRAALDKILAGCGPEQIERMSFSTTLATNAIVQDRLDPTGMIVSAGPGMDPEWFSVGPSYHVVSGCLDHQGFEAQPLDEASVKAAAARIHGDGIDTLGVVGKFSVRNPAHEQQMAEWIGDRFSHVALGHRTSGTLNFPRRIVTTYLNAALFHTHQRFSGALTQILDEKDLSPARFLLKPDGGTVGLNKSVHFPARTAQSGPAASVMGALALDGCPGTTLVLDIGGTTTDMAVVPDGVPLRAPYGIRLGPFRTLIRSLLTRSVGIGGDSEVHMNSEGRLGIGPLRQGPPKAFGGPAPTPTDAMIALGLLEAGDRKAARDAMEALGASKGRDAAATSEHVLTLMSETIASSAGAFLHYINSRPVYTIHEALREEKVAPASAVIIGGPASHLKTYINKALGLPCRVPPHFEVANAAGAALARVTAELTLQADTERGSVVIPEAGIEDRIGRRFNMEEALTLLEDRLREQAAETGADPGTLEMTLTEKQVFTMIRGYSTTGQNIRLKMCVAPGLIPQWKGGEP